MPGLRLILLVLVLALPGISAAQAQSGIAPRSVREAAVAQARAGDPPGALLILRRLLETYPDDPRLLADTTIVASWAGDDAYVFDLYARDQTPKNDAGVTEAAARSARNLHRYDLALDFYRRAQSLAPDRWQPRLGEAMVLTDQGSYAAATTLIEPLLRDHADEADVESGAAYLCSRRGDYACVLAMDQRLLAQKQSADPALENQVAAALSHLGGDSLAFSLRNAANTQDSLYLDASLAAEHIRWAESSDHTWVERKSDSEQALHLLDSIVAATHPQDALWRQAQADRILALFDLERRRAVIEEWQHLRDLKITLPDYALADVASSLLALRHPHQAELLYRILIQHTPGNANQWAGLAYAQFEQEHIRQAFATIDQAYGDAPSQLVSKGLKVPQSNTVHTGLGLQAAEMRGYADLTQTEQNRLKPMLDAAPANPDLNRAMASVFLARGWPRRALRQERIADSYAERDELPVLEDAEILEGAGRRDDADTLIPALLGTGGPSAPMNRFLLDRAIDNGWQLDAENGYEWSNGQFLGNSQHSDAHLQSPLYDNRFRAFIHGWGENGTFTRGATYRSRGGLGVRYDYARQSAWFEVAADDGTSGARPGFILGGEYSLGDHWTFRAEGDTDDVEDVQLIAEINGVRARSVNLTATWSQNELRSIHAGLQRMLYSDGNQRAALSAGWDQRIITRPHLQIEISPEEWTSADSENENRIYFNPKHDFSLGPRVTAHWLTWRRYDRSLWQDATFYAAPYWQENYGTAPAVSISYGDRIRLRHNLGIFDKVTWNSQPYDGKREPYTDFTFGLKWGSQ